MPEFDAFSQRYTHILDQCISFSGEGTEYFAENKALYIARALAPSFSGRVLDYGCGIGLLAKSLLRLLPGARVDGYDISAASLRELDPELAGLGRFTDNTEELRSDYDLILVANVMHHIDPRDRPATFRALKERLVPGGRLMVFEHNPYNPLTRWIVKHCAFDKDAVLLSSRETLRHMAAAGFMSLRRDYITFMPGFLSSLRPWEAHLGWCPLGAQYAAVGRLP